ncbi:MAG: hypothetical protein WAP57_06290 [Aquabacterium commune]|uniref:hypothetical protein n=1 Tax=Aquabacterium commune TaxID=70586 RepID=UPI003BAFEF4B|tara:strand:- start:697 stop:1269 length:573 start_codon:yes stop_codon:yes gene_type:complete
MSNRIFLASIFFILICGKSHSEENLTCNTSKPQNQRYGTVSRAECKHSNGTIFDAIKFQEKTILKDTRLFPDDANNDKSMRIYTSGSPSPSGCPEKLYLIDFNFKNPTVIAFGVKNACNEFHWASWGAKRSVIALKNNVQFKYENGKLTPPKQGLQLFNSIEPPHSSAAGGMTQDNAIPFAEDVQQIHSH